MKKLVKALSAVTVAAILAASLAGCGTQTEKKAETTQSASQGTTADKPVTLRFSWWGGDSRHKVTLDAIAAYEKKYPNVTIQGEYGGYSGYQQKLMTQLAGDAAPDLIQIDPNWNSQLGQNKASFVDLSKESAIDMSQFDTKVLQGFCTVNGIVIGLPMGINGYGLQINKAFMQKFNIPLDKQWTWDDIIAEGKKIHDQDKESYLLYESPIMLAGNFITNYLREKTGKYWINDDLTLVASKEELTDMFTTLKKLYVSGAVAPYGETSLVSGNDETYPRLIKGQIGMIEDWSGTLPKNKSVMKPENFSIGNAIIVKDGKDLSTSYKPSMLLAVNKKSANVQEAVKFTNWFLNDKDAALILRDERSIPGSAVARKALVDAKLLDKDVSQMVENTLKNPAPPMPQILYNSEIATIIKDTISEVAFGKKTPEQATDELIKRITDKLTELKAKK